MQTTELSRTAEKLAEMFTENTGAHMLDSGGVGGRNWERNQGKTAADFLAAPEGSVDEFCGLMISAFHFCHRFLEIDSMAEGMTADFRAWVEKSPMKWYEDGARFYNSFGDFQDWLAEAYDIPENETEVFNTYNWENFLDQVLQGVEFALGDVRLVALSVHGGADIRGGYSDLVVFRRCECWLYQSGDASSSCNNCGLSLEVCGFVDETLWDSRGQNEVKKPEGWEVTDNCPKCKTGKFETAYLWGDCWC